MKGATVHLGFEVGTGASVEIPVAHTFVTGQTQLSGKTTALRGIVERSGRRALAFVTKRGETFDGRRVQPFLPREGDRAISWRLVESILASALGQRAMKYERLWIVNAAKGATSLQQVRDNVTRLQAKHKSGAACDMYMLLGEYLDLVLPEMRALRAVDELTLQPGLNVMDLAGVGLQLQALVIRAALERINLHETGVLTVFPEAWEFAPRGRSAPAKDEAIAMARKGAVLGNFLLCDSQDIAGVDTVVRQAASVWLLGVQRELNEVKRTLAMIPAGVKKPKADDVAQLELGQFHACWGRHAMKVYVQPAWSNAILAQNVALGRVSVDQAVRHNRSIEREAAQVERKFIGRTPRPVQEDEVNAAEAKRLQDDNARLARENEDLRARLDRLESSVQARPTSEGVSRREEADRSVPRCGSGAVESGERRLVPFELTEPWENVYEAIKTRLIDELPGDSRVMELVLSRPELRVIVERHVISVDGKSLRGRIARLISDEFFAQARTSANVLDELLKRGADRPSNIELGNEMKALCDMGFFTRENKWYSLVPRMKVNVVERG